MCGRVFAAPHEQGADLEAALQQDAHLQHALPQRLLALHSRPLGAVSGRAVHPVRDGGVVLRSDGLDLSFQRSCLRILLGASCAVHSIYKTVRSHLDLQCTYWWGAVKITLTVPGGCIATERPWLLVRKPIIHSLACRGERGRGLTVSVRLQSAIICANV